MSKECTQTSDTRPAWFRQKPAIPPTEGWYRVMYPGDSESVDGHVYYDFPDYEDWAYWSPAEPDEYEDFDGGYKGSWLTSTSYDADGDGIFAYAGPVAMPVPFREVV